MSRTEKLERLKLIIEHVEGVKIPIAQLDEDYQGSVLDNVIGFYEYILDVTTVR